MLWKTLDWLKRSWLLLGIIAAGLIIFGDAAQLAVTVYNLSTIALVLLLADFLLDSRENWGIFPSLDINEAIRVAVKGSQEFTHHADGSTTRRRCGISAALVFLGFVLLLVAILFLAVPTAHGAPVPDRARPYLPVLGQAIAAQWPAAPCRHIPAGQVEQESGWKERATLKTSRELGRGLCQLTIAYDGKGKERFNIYRDAVRCKALSGWDWQRDPYNPRYQLTFLVIQDRSNFSQVRPYSRDDAEAWRCALVCYNAGSGRWLARRRNARAMGVPADRWSGGLENAHGPAENATLYDRPLWQAVNEYPRVIFSRAEKYRGLM
jgi:hypothetical protein